MIPSVKGIEEVDYLNNESVLVLEERPESLVIIGGGYIAAEYGHFFSAMGTAVTILQRGERLVKNEEPEISDLLKREMEKRMKIYTSTEALEVMKDGKVHRIIAKDKNTGEKKEFMVEKIMVFSF